MDKAKALSLIKDKYIGRKAKVTTKNNRIFEGIIMCIDYKTNVILH